MTSEGLERRLFPELRPRERDRFLFFAALSALLTGAQTVGLAGTDALFLAELGPSWLPLSFIMASAVAVTGSLAYGAVVGRVRNDRLFVWILVAAGIVLLAAAGVYRAGVRPVLFGIFCGAYLTQAVFIFLHFWTFATDYFDTLASKRLFPYLVVCGSAGGVAGGALGVLLSRSAPTESLIVAWALGLLCSALLVHGARRRLSRWIGVAAESDESSVEGIRAAARYVRRSPLAGWLTISIVGLTFALFMTQYLEMKIMTEAFPNAEALASFLGIYLAVTNAIEIVVARVLTPALIRRFGVAQANLAHPVLTLATFGALALQPTLAVAVLARGNRELMDNALATPIRTLAYNALPFRFRGRVRAFLEGTVFYGSMSIAGLTLLLMGGEVDMLLVCAVGGMAAVVYGASNWNVRREYVRSLVGELRRGRLDLDAVGADLGELEINRLALQWEDSLYGGREPTGGLLELPPLFARHGVLEPLRRNASHEHPAVRAACVEALSLAADPELGALLVFTLDDREASVRLAGVRAAAEVGECDEQDARALAERLTRCLDDSDAGVRAEAALGFGGEGLATLREMIQSADPRVATEALLRAPAGLLPEALSLTGDDEPGVRASALDCVTRLDAAGSLDHEQLDRDLDHADPRVRRAAVRTLGALGGVQSAASLSRALDDPARDVRFETSRALAAMGELGVQAALPCVESLRQWTVDAALVAVARAGAESSRAVLESGFRARVHEAWDSDAALGLVAEDESIAGRFLKAALENAGTRSRWLAFRTLELLEDAAVVRSVRKALDYPSPRARADALEVLSNLGEREAAQRFALLLEEGALRDKLPDVALDLDLPREPSEVLARAANSKDPWLRMAALASSTPLSEIGSEVRTMEGLLALRKVALFTHLSLEQLEAISGFMGEVEYLAGEVVVRQGEPGEDLYVMIEGEAEAYKNYRTPNEIPLTTMSPDGAVSYFGEIAILDNDKRSATVVVTKDARLLTLNGDRFMELIVQSPEISLEIFKVLTARLRASEGREQEREDQERAASK